DERAQPEEENAARPPLPALERRGQGGGLRRRAADVDARVGPGRQREEGEEPEAGAGPGAARLREDEPRGDEDAREGGPTQRTADEREAEERDERAQPEEENAARPPLPALER